MAQAIVSEAPQSRFSKASATSKSDLVTFGSFVSDGDVLGLLALCLIEFNAIFGGAHVLERIFKSAMDTHSHSEACASASDVDTHSHSEARASASDVDTHSHSEACPSASNVDNLGLCCCGM